MRVSGMYLFAFLTLSLVPACDTPGLIVAVGPDAPTAPVPTSISVNASVASLVSGQQAQLTATVKDNSGNVISTAAVSWSSATPALASVSTSGLVTALAPGNASIVAQSSAATASFTLPIVAGDTSAPVPPPQGQGTAVIAASPRVYISTSMPTRGGRTISVPPGGDLQAALNQAVPGDEIVLQAGATYTGNFVLPVKSGATMDPTSSSVIVVRTSALNSLPEGKRVGPSSAASMARIVTAVNGAEALATAPSTMGWRLAGLEITASSGVTTLGRLVRFGDGSTNQNTAASVPQNIVLDRSYVHAGTTLDVRRCIDLQSGTSAIVDSYISGCHSTNGDAQAIASWNGPGPYKIANNYLEGSAENLMVGGADISVPGQLPSDIEIRGNYFSKPLSWKRGDPAYAGTPWTVKNLFEIKMGQRILVEGNVFENSWVDAQVGFALLVKTSNDQAFPTTDVIIRHNIIRGAAGGLNVAGIEAPIKRVTVEDNLFIDIGSTFWDPTTQNGRLFVAINAEDLSLVHNTGISAGDLMNLDPAPSPRLTIADNIVTSGAYGLKGSGYAAGTATLNALAPGGSFVGNVVIGSSTPSSYPSGNYFASSIGSVGFSNPAGGDYSLAVGGPYSRKATDGRDPGIDSSTLLAATAGVKP